MKDNKFWNQKGITRLVGASDVSDGDSKTKKEGGKEITFYPLPLGVLLKVKNTLKEASPFIAICFVDKTQDQDTEKLDTVTTAGDGAYPTTSVITKAVSPSTASHRFKQRKEGIDSLLEALCADNTRGLLAEIVIASASEEFSEDDKDMLIDQMPINVLMELLSGVLAASSGAFAELGEYLPRPVRDLMADGVKSANDNLKSGLIDLEQSKTDK